MPKGGLYMRKIFGVLLSVLCICCAAIGLTGCKKDKHIHAFDKQVITDEYKATDATCTEAATYYYSCECGEKGAETFEYGDSLGHSFTNYVSDNNATCTQDGTKTAKCDKCNEKDTVKDIDSKLHHSYTKQIVSDEYLASSATCTEKATYYYSCECGEKGTETFEYGSTINHNFVNGSCTYCGKKQEPSRGLAFTLFSDGTYEVSGIGSCTDTEIVIPSVYNDKPVTSIGNSSFSDRSRLTSVTIPDSVTSIGDEAFSGCSGIESLVVTEGNKKYHSANNCIIETGTKQLVVGCKTSIIPSDGSVTSIGDRAFYNCSGLTSVTIPDCVTSIGDWAFSHCYKLVEVINKSGLNIEKGSEDNGYVGYYALNVKKDGISDIVNKDGYLFYTYDNVNYLLAYVGSNTDLTLPDDYNGQIYKLYNYAFYRCSGLTSVIILDSVTSIGNSAFRGCSGLTSVTIPDSVTSIGNYAFRNCSGLTSVTIPDNVTSIGDEAFSGCSSLTSVTIPDSVTSIGYGAFEFCSGLTSVTIPNSVTSIGDGAFRGCSGLTSVTIGNRVTSIGDEAFDGCSGLTSVTIPDSVTSIGGLAFYRCSGLTSVTIGNSVTSIGDSAFYYCRGLTSVTIGNSVTSIGDWAFSGCSGLTSVTIPDSVTSIGYGAFNGCRGLTGVYITDLAKWCAIDFSGYSANPLEYAHNLYLNNELITNLIIPDSVTSIGNYAFV